MKKIIDLGKLAPEQNPIYLTASPFLIEKMLIPALRVELEEEIGVDDKIFLDFKAFENKSYHSLLIMESIMQLLKELNIVDRTIFVNLPVAYYEYLNELLGDKFNMTTAFREMI